VSGPTTDAGIATERPISPTTAAGAATPAALPGLPALQMLGGDGPGCVGDACDLPAPEPRER
jgi:hypothetical protein